MSKLRECQKQVYTHWFLRKTMRLHLLTRNLSPRILNQVSFSCYKVCWSVSFWSKIHGKYSLLISCADFKHAFLKPANHMLGGFPAPPAFVSEYPIKDGALRLNSAAHSSSSVHVTAGMIRIRSVTLSCGGIGWSLGKNGELDVILSIEMSRDDILLTPAYAYTPRLLSNKMSSVIWWCWVLLVFWILVLSASVKVGLSVRSR